MMRTFRRIGVLAALALLASSLAVPSASASARACASDHELGSTCLQVNGDGLTVTSTSTSHSHFSPTDSFCNFKAQNTGTYSNGTKMVKVSPLRSSCVVSFAVVGMAINRTFKHDTGYCGRMFHDGAWARGIACVTIKR